MTTSTMKWLLLFLFCELSIAAPVFVDDPFEIDPVNAGNIYLPPSGAGDLQVVCSTRQPASITWITVTGNLVYGPGQTQLNITQVNDTMSVLYVRNGDTGASGILLINGPFQCHANDTADLTENSTRTFTFLRGRYPEFNGQPGNMQVNEGQNTELTCSINDAIAPSPSVVWIFQNNSAGNFTLQTTRVEQDSSQRTFILELSGYRREDGKYWCSASNQFGTKLSKTSRVTVAYFDEKEFNFTIVPSVVKEGEQVTFSVQIDSNPPASSINIRKVKGNIPLASTVNNNSFLYNVKATCNMTGVYNATAIHQSISYTQTASLTVLCRPVKVTFVANVSHNSFIYMWNISSNGGFSNVTISINCSSDVITNDKCKGEISKTMNILSGVTNGSGTLEGLYPNTLYQCQVFAENEVGATGSEVRDVTTLATVPDKPEVVCAHTGETLIKAEWTVSFNGGKPISRYEVIYHDLLSNISRHCIPKSTLEGGGSCQLANVTRNRLYRITVRATNMIGASLPGEITCKATCTLDLIQNKSYCSNEEVYLKFFRPSSECRNITDYQVRLCNMTSLLESSFNQSDTEIWINVKGLKTDDHCVDVTAIGSAGFTRRRIHVNISAGRDCEVSVSDATNLVPIIVPIVVVVLVVAAVGGGYGGYKYNQGGEGEKKNGGGGVPSQPPGGNEQGGGGVEMGEQLGREKTDSDASKYTKPPEPRREKDPPPVEATARKEESSYAVPSQSASSGNQTAPKKEEGTGKSFYAELHHAHPDDRPMARRPPKTVVYAETKLDPQTGQQIVDVQEADDSYF